MEIKGRHLGVLVKPVSSKCNMRCGYCFYTDLAKNRTVPDCGTLTEELTEIFVQKLFKEQPASVSIALQGGEPVLWGEARCLNLIRLAEKYNTRKVPVSYSIQTNGFRLTEEFVQIFKNHHFLVGVSLDGTRSIHDLWRKDSSGNGTFAQVLKNIKRLRDEQIDYNILSVVTKESVPAAEKIFRFYLSIGADHLQFLPCMEAPGGGFCEAGDKLNAAEYGEFLVRLYELWEEEFYKGNYISIRRFDNYLYLLKGEEPESCAMSGSCGSNLVMEADGSFYPCDFYVTDRYYLGNIKDRALGELLKAGEAFRREERGLTGCSGCKYLSLCRGGCKRDLVCRPDGTVFNRYCASYRHFFDKTLTRMKKIMDLTG